MHPEAPFAAGRDSLRFEADIGPDELRGAEPAKRPAEIKREAGELLDALRRAGGLGEQAERNIESYFVVADAFEADGLVQQASDALTDLVGNLRELAAARAGRDDAARIIETPEDLLPYRDAHNLHVVDERYITGAQPTERGYRWLQSKGVTTVVSLRVAGADRDREIVEGLGLRHVHVSWPDEEAPSVEQIDKILETIEEAPGRVFQHCLRGIGRDNTASSCYLIAQNRETPESLVDRAAQDSPRWASDQDTDEHGEPVQFALLKAYENRCS